MSKAIEVLEEKINELESKNYELESKIRLQTRCDAEPTRHDIS